jgi:hypothetical protein
MGGILGLAQNAAIGGTYLSWGIFDIQLGNLIVILVMLVLFVLALVIPFPAWRKRK